MRAAFVVVVVDRVFLRIAVIIPVMATSIFVVVTMLVIVLFESGHRLGRAVMHNGASLEASKAHARVSVRKVRARVRLAYFRSRYYASTLCSPMREATPRPRLLFNPLLHRFLHLLLLILSSPLSVSGTPEVFLSSSRAQHAVFFRARRAERQGREGKVKKRGRERGGRGER